MDGTNRFRFAKDPESLAAWESASNMAWPAKAGGPKTVDDSKGADHAA